MNRIIEGLPCEFSALDAATIRVLESFAPGYVRYERDERAAGGLVVFHLLGDDVIGDYGAIELYWLRAGRCALRFHDPSAPPERAWTADEVAGLDELTDVHAYDRAVGRLVKTIRQEAAELQRGKRRRQVETVKAFLHRLSQEDIWTPAARARLAKPDDSPAEPGDAAGVEDWFVWRAACAAVGYRVGLKFIAGKVNLSPNYIKTLHAEWKSEHAEDVT